MAGFPCGQIQQNLRTFCRYGDKVPKSTLARLFATVWMIAGIILLSMFTAQVSSRLTTQELMSGGDHLFGKKVGNESFFGTN